MAGTANNIEQGIVVGGNGRFEQYGNVKLGWLVGIHLVFLGSLLTVVVADRLSEPGKPKAEKAE